jgi:hypothetical protein
MTWGIRRADYETPVYPQKSVLFACELRATEFVCDVRVAVGLRPFAQFTGS